MRVSQDTKNKKGVSQTFVCETPFLFLVLNTLCWRLPTLPSYESTIGDSELNFRVRNGNGCTLASKAPTYNIQSND